MSMEVLQVVVVLLAAKAAQAAPTSVVQGYGWVTV